MKSRKYLLISERPINHLLEIVALEHPGIGIQIQRSLESKAYPFLVIFTYHAVEHRIVNFKVHFGCGGRLDRGPGQWDYAPCDSCGKKVNTHQNAAKLLAARS